MIERLTNTQLATQAFFTLGEGVQIRYSSIKGTVVQNIVDRLVTAETLLRQTIFETDGSEDSLVYYPDYEKRQTMAQHIRDLRQRAFDEGRKYAG